MANVVIQETKPLDDLLAEIDIMMRTKAIKRALRKRGGIVARDYRRRVPRGNPEDRDDHKPLHRSITTFVRQKKNLFLMVTGARYPDAFHAHLVENKRELPDGRMTQGRLDLTNAIDTTMQKQEQAMIDSLVSDIKKAGG